MVAMVPSAELLSRWAAEELWDWRVRALFAALCVVFMLLVLAAYLLWGRLPACDDLRHVGRARRYLTRLSVTSFAIAIGEASFFREPVAAVLLVATGIAVGIIALHMPGPAPHVPATEGESE